MEFWILVVWTLWIIQVDRLTQAQLFWDPVEVECTQENPCQNGGVCLNLRRPYVGRESVTCSATSCVKIFRKVAASWRSAVATCQQNGGQLVSLETVSEQAHIARYISEQIAYTKPWDNPDDVGFWTSGRYYPAENVWFWHDRSSLVSPSREPSVPAEAAGEQCLSVRLTSTEDFRLESASCALEKHFICELPKETLVEEWTYACKCPHNYYGYNCEHHRAMIEVTVCQGNFFNVSCQEGLSIQTHEARFSLAGTRCSHQGNIPGSPTQHPCRRESNLIEWMQQQYDGLNTSQFEVTSNLPGYQICPERRKVLDVVYQCFDEPSYTTFTCERTNVTLNCKHDKKILVEYANYGRLNRTICIVVKEEDMERCRAIDSLNIVAGKCNGKSVCTIPAENMVFGDPCNGYFKYLETRYRCVEDDITFVYPPVPGWVPPTTPPPETHCGPRAMLGLDWPMTAYGLVAYVSCIVDDRYFATWLCSADLEDWDPTGPNITRCPSPWIYDIESKLQNMSISTSTIAQSVIDQVSSDGEVTSEVLRQSVVIMDALLDRQRLQLTNNTDEREVQKTLVEFNRVMLQLGSTLLEGGSRNSWSEGDADSSPSSAITVFNITDLLESCSLLLAEKLSGNVTSESIETEGINLEVARVNPVISRAPRVRFPLSRLANKERVYRYKVDVPTLSTGEARNATDGEVTMSILVYDTLDTLLQAGLEEPAITNESSMVSPSATPMLGYNSTSIIASVVIGVTMRVGNMTVTDLRGHQMNFTLKHKNMSLEGATTCVFWDHKANDNLGGWSLEGCRKTSENQSRDETSCACSHLTNFAILMDVQGTHAEISEGHTIALELISIIGCTISVLCLAVSILVFSCFKAIRNVRTSIHRNLCLALMIAELLFLFGVNLTETELLCTIVAASLHYFFLTAFVWMCLEGVQLYIMLVHVFHTDNKVLPYYLVGYGVPAIIVGVAAGVNPSGYGTEHYCWLSTDDGFIWSFAGPVLFIIFVNTVFLTRALRVAYSKSASMKKENQRNPSIRSWIKGGLTLMFLLGTTWLVGFAFVSAQTVFMAYVFTVLNSLQGLFIFFFHCVGNERIQREVARNLAKQPWVPKCIRRRLLMGSSTTSALTTTQVDTKRKKEEEHVVKPAEVFLVEDTGSSKRKSPTFFNNPQIKVEGPEPARYSWLHQHGVNEAKTDEYISSYPEPDYT